MAAGRRPWLKSLYRTDKLETLGEARAILKFARSQTEQAAPNLTHPLRCLDAIEYGITHGGYAGSVKVRNITKCQATVTSYYAHKAHTITVALNDYILFQEEEIFRELVGADTAKALVHLFFAQRLTVKV